MKVIKPIAVTDATLYGCSEPEDDYAAWAIGTTYGAGDKVIVLSTHKIYESLQAANTGNDPTTATDWWLDLGPTNRWKMLVPGTGLALPLK